MYGLSAEREERYDETKQWIYRQPWYRYLYTLDSTGLNSKAIVAN